MDKDVSSKLEKLEDNQAKLTVVVSAPEVDRRIKVAYRDAAKKNRFPGFRQGKAPRGVIDNAFGGKEYVLTQATDALLNDLYPLALNEQDVCPLGDPQFGEEGIVADGEEYTFSVTFEVKPEYELSSYDPVEIELPAKEASPADIENQVNALREYYYTFEDITGRTVKDDDYVVLAIHAEQDGEPVEALCSDERIYQVGKGQFSEEFDKKLRRMKIDATKEFTLKEDGVSTDYKVTVKGIRVKVLPAMDDEFAKKCGFESYEEMTERIGTSITEQKTAMQPRIKEQAACYAASERLEGETPESLLKLAQNELAQQLFIDLQRQGMTLDVYMEQRGITPEQLQEDMEKQSADVAKQQLALDAIVRHLDLKVTDSEIEEEFEKAGLDNPEKVKKEWEDSGRIPELRESMLRSKATDWLVEGAVVTEVTAEEAAAKAEAEAAKEEKKPAKKKTAPKQKAAKDEESEAEKAEEDAPEEDAK